MSSGLGGGVGLPSGATAGASGHAGSIGGGSTMVGSGGSGTSGGNGTSGGAASGGGNTGGSSASGGTNATGGTNAAGGSNAVGGNNAAGGKSAVGGAGGASAGGTVGAGGASGGSSGVGGAGPSDPSGLPVPATTGVARPSGAPGNFMVLNWAGFKGAVSFTFDDALSSQISNYAALQGTGVHLTFYLVSNNNGTSATWAQALKDGHELGNHTAHHCHDNGSLCSWGAYAGSLAAELDQCTSHIEQQFGASDVWTAASPYGDTGYQTPDSTRFLLNRGVQGGQVGANDNTSPYALPCHLAAAGEAATGANGFNSATDSARTSGKWQLFLIHSLGGSDTYNPVSVTEVVSSLNHAKSLGDVWADSVVHVGAYWRAQKLLSGITPTTSGSSKTWTWTLPAHFPPGMYLRVKVDGGTLSQGGKALGWSSHGYYEVALDAGSVQLSP